MGISVTKLLIILAIVILFFGTKRLKNVGADLGAAIKGFRSALNDGEEGKSADNSSSAEGSEKQDKNV